MVLPAKRSAKIQDSESLAGKRGFTEESDARLLARIGSGRGDAFDAFVERYKHRLLSYLSHRLGDHHRAEDLAQEVFLRIFRAADRARADDDLSAWVFTIAQNCLTDYLRVCQRKPLQLETDSEAFNHMEAIHDPSPSPLAYAIDAESAELTARWLVELPPEQQEVVALKIYAELTFPQISDVVDAPVPTVKSRMRYGLLKLGKLIGRKDSSP